MPYSISMFVLCSDTYIGNVHVHRAIECTMHANESSPQFNYNCPWHLTHTGIEARFSQIIYCKLNTVRESLEIFRYIYHQMGHFLWAHDADVDDDYDDGGGGCGLQISFSNTNTNKTPQMYTSGNSIVIIYYALKSLHSSVLFASHSLSVAAACVCFNLNIHHIAQF